MNLQDVWKKLELEKLEVSKPSPINPWATKSKHPVEKLKNAYKITTLFSVVFLAGFIILVFLFHEWIVKIGIIIMILVYILFTFINYRMYRSIQTSIPLDQNLKKVLQDTHHFIKSNILFQERFALFVYPLAAASGMLMGLAAGGGEAEKFLREPDVVMRLILIPLLLTPISWLLARWMYKVSYGVCLGELKRLIEELEKSPEVPS